jgi:hypothetical protein
MLRAGTIVAEEQLIDVTSDVEDEEDDA